jgi:hypothetical protein
MRAKTVRPLGDVHLGAPRSDRSQRLDRYETSPPSRPGANRELTGAKLTDCRVHALLQR